MEISKESKYVGVKSRTTTLHRYTLDGKAGAASELVEKSVVKDYEEYNADGNRTKHVSYFLVSQKPDEDEVRTWNYNENGHLIEEITHYVRDDYQDHKTYEVDANGNVLKELNHYEDGSSDTTTYAYDDKMRVVGKETINSDDESDGKEVWSYGPNGLIEKLVYDYEGELEGKHIFERDANGNTLKHQVFAYDDLEEEIVQTYNDKNQITSTTIGIGKAKIRVEFEYDEHGNSICERQIELPSEKLRKEVKYSYSDDNLVTEAEQVHHAGMNDKLRLSYEYER